MINVTIWNEFLHEKTDERCIKIYPDGIHGAIRDFLKTDEELNVRTITLDDPDCGITDELLDNTDVMLWWGHIGHDKVPDEIAAKVRDAVLKGMGLIVLHSGHHSKVFKMLMGTSCNLTWRENGDMERVWVSAPAHPIAQGLGRYFELDGVDDGILWRYSRIGCQPRFGTQLVLHIRYSRIIPSSIDIVGYGRYRVGIGYGS